MYVYFAFGYFGSGFIRLNRLSRSIRTCEEIDFFLSRYSYANFTRFSSSRVNLFSVIIVSGLARNSIYRHSAIDGTDTDRTKTEIEKRPENFRTKTGKEKIRENQNAIRTWWSGGTKSSGQVLLVGRTGRQY